LDQHELPLRVLTRCEERHQPASVPDRLFAGLPPSTKCDGFFGPHSFRACRCHDWLPVDVRRSRCYNLAKVPVLVSVLLYQVRNSLIATWICQKGPFAE